MFFMMFSNGSNACFSLSHKKCNYFNLACKPREQSKIMNLHLGHLQYSKTIWNDGPIKDGNYNK